MSLGHVTFLTKSLRMREENSVLTWIINYFLFFCDFLGKISQNQSMLHNVKWKIIPLKYIYYKTEQKPVFTVQEVLNSEARKRNCDPESSTQLPQSLPA